MSEDFQLAFPCPHYIDGEKSILDTDRVTLQTRQPLFGTGMVRVLVNDQYLIPSTGYYSSATLIGSVKEPFRIPLRENTVSVTTPNGTVTRALTVGYRTVAELVPLFTVPNMGLLAEASGGRLILRETTRVGLDSWVNVQGFAASALGFGQQHMAAGRNIFPGWRLLRRPMIQGTVEQGYTLQFTEPFKANPYFRVSYPVPRQYCLRCRSTGVENDYGFDAKGEALMVQDENLLYQASLKIMLTDLQSNPYHPWYGTVLRSLIGQKAIPGTAETIKSTVRDALANFQKVQQEQAKYQNVSAKERLYSVLSINVTQPEGAPTAFIVDVVVSNFSGDPVSLTIVYTSPGVVALAGTNNLSLG